MSCFAGPFTDVVMTELKLSNPTEKRVCFKVKTTAPKRYCVRPNSGIIEPGGKVAVSLMLQPFTYDPKEKNKHKFMVLTMVAPDEFESQDALWKEMPQDQLMDSKLKCVFEMPESEQNNLDSSVKKDESAKSMDTSFTSAELPNANVHAGNLESELKRSMENCKRLSQDLRDARQENSRLKEEAVRLRKVTKVETERSTPSASSSSRTVSMEEPSASLPPIVYLVAAIILGLIIGKFIL
ncbi:hypothetical protein CAPTEDRAFT_168430 [Capitella teleta]|uniref:MSP domain-containing protein n=1 Tax=Capitella teleta TaxID=283909 RepID=R7VIJ7_CAPTE|nr:hypothetical protein CAPTEDRAFT_168430 [Capitella teleta]|eukprot:ELU18444.1 hypothetical protein CAPTEDRAFT_168430 [Capitella teleta]